jgi:hypothetical protein
METVKTPHIETLTTSREQCSTVALLKSYGVNITNMLKKNFLPDAQKHFLQRFWEMYLWAAFQYRGFKIIKQNKRNDEHPDLCLKVADHTVWIEAIAPNAGTTYDRVPDIPYCKNLDEPEAFDIPTEKIILRYTNALSEKLKQYKRFCKKGIVKPTDIYIIAINGYNIPHAQYGSDIPFHIKAFLPFGNLTVSIDTATSKITDTFYQHSNHVEKLNEEKVCTQPFLDPEYAGISAVIHSATHCTNSPRLGFDFGYDFDILHNPHSKNPLPNKMLLRLSWCKNRFYNSNSRELNTVEP